MNVNIDERRWSSRCILGLCYGLAVGCASEPAASRADGDPSDRTANTPPEDSTSSAPLEMRSSGDPAADAAVSTPVMADAATWGETRDAASDPDVTTTPETDTQRIEQPTIRRVSFEELCTDVAALEGTVFDVDLTNVGRLGEWVDVTPAPFADAGVELAWDAAAEAGTCLTRFAPFELPCRGSVLVVTAPTRVFGSGPSIGEETVGLGCWEAECNSGCVPSELAGNYIGVARARVIPVVDARFDEALMTYVGDLRVNGVTLNALAGLEILELP